TFSRQILVTHVGAKSPADGVIKIDDVILGVADKPFADDARKSIALAIADAEKETNQGKLTLLVWRQGKTEKVQLKLRVMGSYSATAPFNCPKSKLIFDEACKVLENEPLRDDMWGAVNGLALMATGNPEYLPRVKALAHKIGPKTLKLELKDGMFMWDWGYRNVFLCEYYLLTGDKDVLPAINEYAISLAKGQSMYGTFGHGIAKLTPDGQLHGSIPPYGPVNAAGLIANMAIVMGKNCGVKHPEIEPAVDRASKFFGYFVDKGAIPYGEHMPWPNHENNGKNAMTALLFGLQGNRIRETQFWAKMVTASYQNREYGHTGQGFSYLWGALGANTGGPDALAAYFNQASWHFDLVRRSDGSFTYDGGEQFGPGKTDDNTYYGKSSYYGLSPCATYVLTYSIPLKKIALTGRGVDQASWLTKKEVADAIASGRFDLDRKNKTNEELIEAMGDWSPVVRSWAAEELGKRPERKELVPRLIALAEGPDYRKRQGAAETLGYINSAEALPVLVRLLTHEDRWLRVKAANALRNMGDTAKPVVPEMLKAVVVTAEPLAPIVWDDPIQLTHGELAAALFRGLLRTSIKGIDPELLYPAIRAISKNADGMARAQLTHTISNQLTLEDVQALAPDILLAIDIPSPADTMFANEIRMAGLRALSKYNFREGIRVSLKFAQTQSPHGSEKRMGEIMKELLRYGSAAKEVLPDLKVLIIQCQEEKDFPDWAKKMKIVSVEEAIKAIESTSTQPELRTIQAPKSAPKK
ncbi:MAG: HEAT repeat domain-containing protein, partial [Gemmataceae bacterium]|nr:HEAT repeat domain-containing protein [Gemmataceae bacterium]